MVQSLNIIMGVIIMATDLDIIIGFLITRNFVMATATIIIETLDEKFGPAGPIRECSTCLMFEYFNELWGVVLDVDDYADYYDPSYGLDGDDETDFEVHDRLIGKRLRRYLKME